MSQCVVTDWVQFMSDSIHKSMVKTRQLIVSLWSKLGNKSWDCWASFWVLIDVYRYLSYAACLYILCFRDSKTWPLKGVWCISKLAAAFSRSAIFSSKSAVACQAKQNCLLWISVYYLLKTGTRCSGAQFCSDIMFIITPQPSRIILPIEQGYCPAGFPEGSRMFRLCLLLKFKAKKRLQTLHAAPLQVTEQWLGWGAACVG